MQTPEQPEAPVEPEATSRPEADFATSPVGHQEPEQEPVQHLQNGAAVQDPAQLPGQKQAMQTLHESLQTERNRLAKERGELAAREQHTEQLSAKLQHFV